MLARKDLARGKKQEVEELLVFGYSCKLFRDDEKAQTIDEGQHLIPWMGNEGLKIDRYDARGTLFDLSRVEAPPGGYERFFELTDAEKALEISCDKERYRSLHRNEEEDRMYREEEEKRIEAAEGKTYGQVGYSYVEEKPEMGPMKEEVEIEDDRPFVPSPMLDIPVNMALPGTMKHNTVIEKTAMFISSHGAQMEIILKAKQSGNPMFDFLTFGNALHGYYRLILSYIKAGRYVPQGNPEPDAESTEPQNYLHPSLIPTPQTTSNVDYTSTPTVYSELLSTIRKKAEMFKTEPAKPKTEELSAGDNLNISKTAFYASKNGRSFEPIVKLKKDPRYQFLDPNHEHHQFYLKKINYYENLAKENKPEPKKVEETGTKVAPICFAIKPKEPPVVREKSALPVEENSESEDNDEDKDVSDLDPDEQKVPTVRDKQLQLERKRKVSAFLKSLNVKDELEDQVAKKFKPAA